MSRPIATATLARLRTAQAGGMENAKEFARVVHALDQDTTPMPARELRELLLQDHGIDLREDRINRSRYIARLLWALHPKGEDTPELAAITDPETLYLVQRLHEVKGTPHADLLATLAKYQAKNLKVTDIRQRMKDAVAVAQNRATAASRATWRQPLMRVPGDVCDQINTGFSEYTKAQGCTQQQAAVSLSALMALPVSRLEGGQLEALDASLEAFSRGLGVSLTGGVDLLCSLLDTVPSHSWRSLLAAVRPGLHLGDVPDG